MCRLFFDESKSKSVKHDGNAEWSKLVRKGRYPSSFRTGGLRLLSMHADVSK